jgi:beta-1,4-mannosyl-glycoprotein beta-1,4-N-acetylglucosaminyltransferase
MPKVIDAIMFSGELDMLELRLNELGGVVDHFVIVEATEPHGAAGRREVTDPDRLKAVIGPFKDKVHYEVITLDPPYTDRESGWRRENYHRASLMAPVLQWSTSPQDVILVSDADEIPRADVVKNLAPWLVSSGQLAYFGLDMYLYNVNTYMEDIPGQSWKLSYAGTVESFQKAGGLQPPRGHLDQTKPSGNYAVVEGAGWHFSSFFDLPRLREKLRTFAHSSDPNVQAVLKLPDKQMAQIILTPQSIFNGKVLEKRSSTDPTLPKYLLCNPEKFAHFHATHLEKQYGPARFRDATIGVIRGMDWPTLRPYAVSLTRTGFAGMKIMFVEDVSTDVKNKLVKLGFSVIERKTPPPSEADTLLPEHWSYGYHRFEPVIKILEHNAFRYVIWTDVRDVVFQTDPSVWLEKNLGDKKIAFAGLGHVSAGCPYNDAWIKQAAQDDALWEEVRQQETLACGTFAGEYQAMLDLMRDCYEGCLAIPGTVDQGMFNCLVRTSPYKEITKVPALAEGFSAQWWPGKSIAQQPPILPGYGSPLFSADGEVLVPETGELFSIVHLYDRDPALAKIIQEKYADLTSG